jgi:L-amino acid N-acyltransferase YncA
MARSAGRRRVRCVTSPVNTSSLAFHRSLGFHLGGRTDDSLQVSIYQDYDGPGEDRVLLTKEL